MESIIAFVYSPVMLGVQAFSVVVSLGLLFFLWRMIHDTGAYFRWRDEKNASLDEGVEDDARREREKQMQAQSVADSGGDEMFHSRWNNVVARMGTPDESQWKLALIEADALLDYVLQQRGTPGATMGERMQNLSADTFPLLESAWRVHRIRNYLVHNVEYELNIAVASRAFELYRRIFIQMGFVDTS